jgi:large exoprotein involved in heme utilization and adhesion
LIQTQTLGQGSAGTIQVNAGDTINLEGVDSAIRSGSGDGITPDNAIGKGGDIRLTTGNLQVTDGATLSAQTYTASEGGNVIVDASRLQANQGGQLRTTTSGNGKAGDIIVNAADRVDLSDAGTGLFANTTGGSGGAVSVTTNRFEITRNAVLDATTTTASPGGSVTVRANTFNATGGGQLRTTTSGNGKAGDIIVNAADRVDLSDAGTGLFANTTGGPGGAIAVNTNRFQIARGAVLDATTTGANPAGNVTVRANTFNATEGGQLRTTTSGSGQAGDIALEVTNLTLAGSGTGLFASTAADSTGRGGNIRIDSQTVEIQDSARVAVDSQGTGEGGNIAIQTSSMLLNQQAAISAETVSNTGGNITLDVSDLLLLRRNSFISTTAGKAQGAGNGGNIDLSAGFVIAVPNENSDITANAFRGRGGNITITTQGIFGLEFRDRVTPLSDITASSQFGVNGVVTINTPGIDPVQGTVELPTTFSTPSLAQGCQARGRQTSSFVNTGRGGVSTNPTDPLMTDTIWQDLELLEETGKGARAQPTTHNQRLRTNNSTSPMIEAQGWVVLSNGTIALTAEAPTVTPYGMGSKGSGVFCQSGYTSRL